MQTSKKKTFQLLTGIFAVLIGIGLDQLTKQLAVLHLKEKAAISIIPGVFELYYLENHGAAFGILQGQKVFLIAVTAITMILLAYLYIRIPEAKHYFYIRAIILLLISGAIGNFIDRACWHYVVDFIYVEAINFPVFNVADCYVCIAAALLIHSFLFYYKEEELLWKKKKSS